MKGVRLWACASLAVLVSAAPGGAADHNNVDAHRPLSFDDAESLAFREQAVELGLNLGWPRKRPLGLGLDFEYLYGFAMNSHASLGFEPSTGGRANDADASFDQGSVALGLFHNFNREHRGVPALSIRADTYFPTGREAKGVAFRLRGIVSRQAGQYGRLHLNVDLNGNPGARKEERQLHPGVVLGYSRPIGYPTHFQTTGLAELSMRAGEKRGTGPVIGVGVGMRKQVSVRSVLDVGLQSDVADARGAPRDRLRLVVGYSTGF